MEENVLRIGNNIRRKKIRRILEKGKKIRINIKFDRHIADLVDLQSLKLSSGSNQWRIIFEILKFAFTFFKVLMSNHVFDVTIAKRT